MNRPPDPGADRSGDADPNRSLDRGANRSSDSSAAAPHIGDRIPDYFENRLLAASRLEVEAHIAACNACAADFEWARALQADIEAGHLRHVSSQRALELAGAPPTPEEETHLRACLECREAAEWAVKLQRLPDESELASHASPLVRIQTRARRTVDHLRALAVRMQLAPDPEKFSQLARIEPLPVLLPRSETGNEFDEAWIRGIEAYRAHDFFRATSSLGRAAELAPSKPEVVLYLGSAQLLLGLFDVAIQTLTAAVDLASSGSTDEQPSALAEEARWQLANARLAHGDAAAAIPLLEGISVDQGTHADEAVSLLERIAERRGRARG